MAFSLLLGNRATALRGLSLFADLSPVECASIASAARTKRFWKNQIVFSKGDPVGEVIVLVSGCVKTVHMDGHGNEAILKLHRSGEIVGASDCFEASNRSSTAIAVEKSTALVWDATVFASLCERIPAFRRSTTHALQECLHEMEQRFREFSTERVDARLSGELIRLASQLGLEIAMSQLELARLAGTTLSTVNRMLCQWQSQGIVESRRKEVFIKDLVALKRIADS